MIYFWNVKSGEIEKIVKTHSGKTVQLVDWSPSGKQIAISCYNYHPGGYGLTYVYEVETGLLNEVLNFAGSDISWSPDGSQLAILDNNKSRDTNGDGLPDHSVGYRVLFWGANNGDFIQHRYQFQGHIDSRLCWEPFGTKLAIGTDSGNIGIFDRDMSGPILSFRECCNIEAMAWGGANSLLAAISRNSSIYSLPVFNPRSGQRIYPVHHGLPLDVCWSPDGIFMASLWSEVLSIWNSSSGEEELIPITTRWPTRGSLEWSPDGKNIAFAVGDTVWVWPISP
jgi:WD40 repeat protein